jgi:adsorption protein B
VRQKTRWTLGITLQGWRHLGWSGSLANRYFLFRDRKAIFTNFISLVGYINFVLVLGLFALNPESVNAILRNDFFAFLIASNLVLLFNRFWQRWFSVVRVYGIRPTFFIPLRWIIGVTINALASMRALKQDLLAFTQNKKHVWVKTDHELPIFFNDVSNSRED